MQSSSTYPDHMPLESGRRIAGVLLAAGTATRMGANKLLFDLGGEPVVRRVARQAIEAGLSPVLVVLGFEAPRVAAALEGLAVEAVFNAHYATGMNASVQLGIARVPVDCAAAVVVLADMPLVTSNMLTAMVERYRAGDEPLVISTYGDVQAPPTLYSRALFPQFVGPEGEGCGRRIVREHRDRAAVVRWPAHLLADLDRPEDVELLRGRFLGAPS
jgi:molybdenum cofactor cytidylyltransferase